MNRGLGYRAPAIKHRGVPLALAPREKKTVARKVDLRPLALPVGDQGALGCCTGFAFAAGVHLLLQHQRAGGGSLDLYAPSPLWIYARERMLTGALDADEGATLFEGVGVLTTEGVAREDDWPYDLTRWNALPSDRANARARRVRLALVSALTRDLEDLRWCLAVGCPVVIGMSVYERFKHVGADGVIPLPREGEFRVGGHAMTLVGYDDERLAFLVRNSWGEGWGMKGYGWLPYEYVELTALTHELYGLRALTGAIDGGDDAAR